MRCPGGREALVDLSSCDSATRFHSDAKPLSLIGDGRLTILSWFRNAGRQLGAIALLALFVRAIVPAGYMVAAAETSQGRYLVVELCEGHHQAPQVIDLDTGKRVDPGSLPSAPAKDKTSNQTCVFAAAPVFASPVVSAEPVAFRAAVEPVVFGNGDIRPGRGIAAPPPPSTGPPSLI